MDGRRSGGAGTVGVEGRQIQRASMGKGRRETLEGSGAGGVAEKPTVGRGGGESDAGQPANGSKPVVKLAGVTASISPIFGRGRRRRPGPQSGGWPGCTDGTADHEVRTTISVTT